MNTNITTETQPQPRAEMLRDWIMRFTPAPDEGREAAILLSIKAVEVAEKLGTPTLTAQDLRELSPEHTASLTQWIVTEGFAGAQSKIRLRWGLKIHRPTLQRYYAATLNQEQIENVQEISGTADSILNAASSDFGMLRATIVLLEKKIFELLLHERATAKELSGYTDILCKLRRSQSLAIKSMETGNGKPRTRSATRQRKPAPSAIPVAASVTPSVTTPVTSKTEENDAFDACNELFCNIPETAGNFPLDEPFAGSEQPPTLSDSDDPEDSASSSMTFSE